MRRLLFLVVDAGRAPSGAWAQNVAGPSGVDLINAASDTAIESSALSSYLSFQATMNSWKEALTNWRCHLSEAERRRYGAPANWNCRDVRFFISRIAFGALGPERAAALNRVETTLRLPQDQIDMLIAAGHDALQANPAFRGFLQLAPAKSAQHSPSVATPAATEDLAALAKKLPVGRLYSNGKGFVPNIRQSQYSELIATLAHEPQAALTKDDEPLPQVTSGLPRTWDEIAPGHLVIAEELLVNGWWHAIVLDRNGDMLTLRFRDYPKLPKFVRHRAAVALVSTALSEPPSPPSPSA